MKENFDAHNLIAKEKLEVQRQHLKLFRRQGEEYQMTKGLAFLRTSEEDMSPRVLDVLHAMKENIRKSYFDKDYHFINLN